MRRIAVIDIGSNSVRCLVAQVPANGAYRVLTEDRAQTRLAAGLVSGKRLTDEAMQATLDALVRMAEITRHYRVDTVRAVATAALRSASNGARLIESIAQTTGIQVEIISPREEARLAFLGARANFELAGRSLVLDVGGGSVEIVRAAGTAIESDRSLPIGAVVLTERFLTRDPPSDKEFKRLRRWVRQMLATEFGPQPDPIGVVIGSGGSVTALAGMAARIEKWSYTSVHAAELTQAQVAQRVSGLRRMTLEERRAVPGLPEHRADIIVAGALVVAEVMAHFSANSLKVNAKGLREALLLDTIEKETERPTPPADRMRGVLEFARRMRFDREHALHVCMLALSLFDQLAGPLGMDPSDRQLLEAAAVLHDIGYFVSYDKHHKHTYHLVSHATLPGFSPRQVQMIASVARYHRGALPARGHESMRHLSPEDRVCAQQLAALLRVADGLDRSRSQYVGSVAVTVSDQAVDLALSGAAPLGIEVYGALQKGSLFERVFGLDLRVDGHASRSDGL